MNGRHKYNVGDKFDFDGIVEIVECLPLGKRTIPHYRVCMPGGETKLVNEKWLDGGMEHFALAKENSDVYIPAPSREIKIDSDCGAGEAINAINSCTHPEPSEGVKVGDRVQIIDPDNSEPSNIGAEGIVIEQFDNSRYTVAFQDGQQGGYYIKYLRKLPDIISFDNPMDRQVGGEHYKMPIQPVEFIERNGLGFCVGNCIEYLCRYKRKNGREDLEKARHYIDLLIELEYPEDEKD